MQEYEDDFDYYDDEQDTEVHAYTPITKHTSCTSDIGDAPSTL